MATQTISTTVKFPIQSKLMDSLITKTGSKSQLVSLLMHHLHIESSAAYNRINCITGLSLEETRILCQATSQSIDELILPSYESIRFAGDAMRKLPRSYDQYLTNVIRTLEHLSRFPNTKISTIGNEVPLFHFANFPKLYHFKLYYWSQTFWKFSSPSHHFDLESKELDDVIKRKTERIGELYYNVPSQEVWTEGIFSAILNQIAYFLNLGSFKDPRQAQELVDEVKKMSAYLAEFCSEGRKRTSNDDSVDSEIEVFYNEFHDGTDAVLFDLGDTTLSYIKYDGPNFIKTGQPEFGQYSKNWINNIIDNSTGISARDQKSRRMFFRKVDKRIEAAEKRIQYLIQGYE